MTLLLWGMVLAQLVPITVMVRPIPAWDRLAAFASVSTKVAMIILVVAVIRDERMLALVGAIALSAGNAGMMLLAHLLREVET